jgi:hypothetical protein
MVNDSTYMNVWGRVWKSQLKSNPLKTGGVLIYGNTSVNKYVKLASRVFYAFIAFIVIVNLIDGVATKNYFTLGLVVLASALVVRNIVKAKVKAQRIVESDEMLSLWLINQFPTESISSSSLLQGNIVKSSANRIFLLEITNQASTIYVYEPTLTSLEDIDTFEASEIYVVELKEQLQSL